MQKIHHQNHFYKIKSNTQGLSIRPQLILIIFLTGHIRFSLDDIKYYKQTLDYSIIPVNSTPIVDFVIPEQAVSVSKSIDALCLRYSLNLNHRTIINKINQKNANFYSDLLLEFTHFFYMTAKGSHSAAFIFLYRIFERFAYAIPLLYTKLSNQFFGTFNQLKSLLKSDGKQELAFFKTFIKETSFIEYYDKETEFGISFTNSSNPEGFYKILKKHCQDVVKSPNDIDKTMFFHLQDLPDVIVNIRNRFFHYKFGEGQNNISINEIKNTDDFFQVLNPIVTSYLAIITLNISFKDII